MKNKKFRRKFWVNLAWLRDGKSEQFFYAKKEDAVAVSEGVLQDEVRQVEVREL